MKRIAHLSDLHFGTLQGDIETRLLDTLVNLKLDMVIVSGDFTQVGARTEFAHAHAFINKLPCPVFCIPGNHDVPSRNLFQRLFRPFQKYKSYINPDLDPVYGDDTVLIAGINSARRFVLHWNWANGAVSKAQRQHIQTTFDPHERLWTILTLHHPIQKVSEMPINVTVFGRKRTMRIIQQQNIDLVLTGHVHFASLTTIGNEQHQSVFLSASTALSSRTRGQENGFNLITLADDVMLLESYVLKDGAFAVAMKYEHRRKI